jgi:hypothetical protein
MPGMQGQEGKPANRFRARGGWGKRLKDKGISISLLKSCNQLSKKVKKPANPSFAGFFTFRHLPLVR